MGSIAAHAVTLPPTVATLLRTGATPTHLATAAGAVCRVAQTLPLLAEDSRLGPEGRAVTTRLSPYPAVREMDGPHSSLGVRRARLPARVTPSVDTPAPRSVPVAASTFPRVPPATSAPCRGCPLPRAPPVTSAPCHECPLSPDVSLVLPVPVAAFALRESFAACTLQVSRAA